MPDAGDQNKLRNAMLFPYNKSVEIYQCPGDKLPVQGQSVQRVRSYSLNGMMGSNADPAGIDAGNIVHPGIKEHKRFLDVQNPGPSNAGFLYDEQSNPNPSLCSINDGYLGIDFGKKGPVWPDLVASRHGNAPSGGQERAVRRGG